MTGSPPGDRRRYGAGGRRLDQMYTLNRMLDGDAFYMKITS
ncbi:hypothetical protein [Streptomyces dangxiongensis]|nr:hypothetical protein [Streptomyces dangxiongensis]